MRVYVNKADNSVCNISGLYNNVLEADPNIMSVDIDPACLENIPEDEWSVLEYDPFNNTLFKDPNVFRLNSVAGKEKLLSELRRIALIPVEARDEQALFLVELCRAYLPEGQVEEILADNVLTDGEIQDILSYLGSDD